MCLGVSDNFGPESFSELTTPFFLREQTLLLSFPTLVTHKHPSFSQGLLYEQQNLVSKCTQLIKIVFLFCL